jgi:alpha-N-arabinofuranosidase
MCEEAGIEPIVTTTAQWGDEMGKSAENTCCSPSDMADLIEYAYGDASTTWGKTRIADGHPEPYKFRYVELVSNLSHTRAVVKARQVHSPAQDLT